MKEILKANLNNARNAEHFRKHPLNSVFLSSP